MLIMTHGTGKSAGEFASAKNRGKDSIAISQLPTGETADLTKYKNEKSNSLGEQAPILSKTSSTPPIQTKPVTKPVTQPALHKTTSQPAGKTTQQQYSSKSYQQTSSKPSYQQSSGKTSHQHSSSKSQSSTKSKGKKY